MRVLRAIWAKLPAYVLWALLSAILWGWIFGLVTDAPAEKKVVVYIDAPGCRDTALDVELEKSMPEGIRQIRVHLFSYVMFDEAQLVNADLYVVPASACAGYVDSFRALESAAGEGCWEYEGRAYGLPVGGAASAWVDYDPGEEYYLFFGVNSAHAEDGAAQAVAESFLRLP